MKKQILVKGLEQNLTPQGRQRYTALMVAYANSGFLSGERVYSPCNYSSTLTFPTPGSNRKAAKRRAGTSQRHGKAGRK